MPNHFSFLRARDITGSITSVVALVVSRDLVRVVRFVDLVFLLMGCGGLLRDVLGWVLRLVCFQRGFLCTCEGLIVRGVENGGFIGVSALSVMAWDREPWLLLSGRGVVVSRRDQRRSLVILAGNNLIIEPFGHLTRVHIR